MELRQLRYLIAISEEQNINRAAKLCFVTQPALTQQIKKLEDEFNTSFLIRRGRGIILSEDGERLSKYAKNIIRKIDAIKNEFSLSNKERIKQLSIGVVPALHNFIKSGKIFDKSGVNIKLKKMCSEQIEYELRRGLINAGISAAKSDVENTCSRVIAHEKMYVLLSKKHPLSLSDSIDISSISNEPLALLSKNLMQREYINNYLKKNNVGSKIMLDLGSFDELISVVKHSNFFSILPDSLASSIQDNDIRTIKVNNDDFHRDIFLVLDENNKNEFNFLDSRFSELTKALD